jgi:hypothetical protein
MLTEEVKHRGHSGETDSIVSGIISMGSALDLATSLINDELSNAGLKGALILAGEEDSMCEERSRLSLPDSISLPSDSIPLEDKPRIDADEHHAHKKNDRTSFRQSTVFSWSLVVLLFITTSITSWSYINSQSNVRHLQSMLRRQQSPLPLALLLSVERKELNEKISLLERHLMNCHSKSNENIFPHFARCNDDTITFDNCYFKATLAPGECYRDWQTRFNEFMFTKKSDSHPEEYEETFAHQLFESLRTKSSQSYSYVEQGFRNITFDSLATLLSSSVNALGGVHLAYGDSNHHLDLQESLKNVAKSFVHEGYSLAKSVEVKTSESVSRVLDYWAMWLNEEDINSWY